MTKRQKAGNRIGTEVLATVGPATIGLIDALYDAGLSGLRINSSHGDPSFHARAVELSRKARPGAYIIYDIKGPKIRLGDIPKPYTIKSGDRVVLRTDIPKSDGSDYPAVADFREGIPVTYSDLDEFVRPGDRLFIDDGYVGLRVERTARGIIECVVLFGDVMRSRKGLNHPDTVVGYPYTMPQDLPDLEFAIRHGVDFLADSFTRNAEDVRELRERLSGTGIGIISKIENPEGVNNFDEILSETDAVMVARGDLGVEMDPVMLPEMQKIMIEKCTLAGKPVITATQMLESMMENARPSRADVSDIANALYDGTDVLMLSGETSVGKFPVECVRMMRRIAEYVEGTRRYRERKREVRGLSALREGSRGGGE
ncbi:MAG: pyruvate kinase [Spirochaetes bacterium]|jgi:pyruvate kinase|nr:pyruvate kinase [Spirochaetota bacterium]